MSASSSSSQLLLSAYGQHRDALLRFLVRRLGDAVHAEDLAQEVWLRAASSPPADIVNARAYLFRIAGNLVLDHQRRAAYGIENQTEAEIVEAVVDPAPAPDVVAEQRDELARVLRAIETLPPRGRQIFVMHKFEGLSYVEIAERLALSRNTVMVHMTRSLAHLHRSLREADAAARLPE